MSTSTSPAAKGYVDRGIQTICLPPTLWLARSVSNSTKNSSIRAHNGSLSEYSSNAHTSTRSHSRSSSMRDSAYSHSLPLDSPSPVRSSVVARRLYKRQKTPYSRPSPQKPDKRIVSLPEDSPMFHTKTVRESTTFRVVSLPDRLPSSSVLRESSSSIDLVDPSIFMDQSVFVGDEQISRIRVRPPSTDGPHTPSPPSSPDSVLIIENNHQLPETFLRNNSIQNPQQLFSDDEGWITWASSPPRPIPALHGPLSLPYARCPSGAEGTIIEEYDNLPRMIWGLGADDAPSTYSHVSSQNAQHVAPRTNAHSSYTKVPPRLQKKPPSSAYLATPQQTPRLSPNPRDRPMTLNGRDRRTQVATRLRALENLGSRPYDTYGSANALDNMLRIGTAKVAGTWDSLYGNASYQSQDPSVGRPFNMNTGIALDWQLATTQHSLERPAEKNGHEPKPTHFLKPSAPVFVPSSQVSPLPFPRIFIEPRSTQNHKEHNQARHIPAIERAQQPRKQQTHQNVLPTPPSSSSPQWSSNFSPYQISSPDIAPPRSSKISDDLGQQKQRVPADSSHDLRRFVYEHIGSGCPNRAKCLPSAVSRSHATKFPQAPTHYSDVSRIPRQTQHISKPSPISVSSPPHPGPPPSTPLPPLPSISSTRDSRIKSGPSSFSTTFLSPETRPRSLSYQHPRSIPLARLVRRRLSSVPEEDLSSVRERNCPSPTPLSVHQTNISHAHTYMSHEQLILQIPQQQEKQFHSSTTRTPSPIPAVLALRSRARSEFDSGEFLIEPGLKAISGPAARFGSFPAKVRLPLKMVHVEQTKEEHDDKTIKHSEEHKENLLGEIRPKSMNLRKRGHGRKNKTSSIIGLQAHAPAKGGGGVSIKA